MCLCGDIYIAGGDHPPDLALQTVSHHVVQHNKHLRAPIASKYLKTNIKGRINPSNQL